jgi:putative flippase GtrA
VRRFGVFSLIAAVGFVIQLTTLMALTRVCGWHLIPATAAAIELAILHNFVGDTRWTWADRRLTSIRGWVCRFGRYQAAKSLTVVLNLFLTLGLSAAADLPPEVANACAVALVSVVSYVVSDRFVFEQVG